MTISHASNDKNERIYEKLDFLFNHFYNENLGSVEINQRLANALSKHVGKSYGYTYIISIRNRTFPLTKNIIKATEAEYKRVTGYVPLKRYRRTAETKIKEEYEVWGILSNKERCATWTTAAKKKMRNLYG